MFECIRKHLKSYWKKNKVELQSKILLADGTYKIIWQGLPVIIVESMDICKHFVEIVT